MFNPFAMFFSVIDIAKPPVDDDDTAPFVPVADEAPILRTHPITLRALLSLDQLHGALAAYRIDTDSPWQVGHIRATEESKFGVHVLFEPADDDNHHLPKWRHINDVQYAWWE